MGLRSAFKKIGKVLKKAAPILAPIAMVAFPGIGTALGAALGATGATAGALGSAVIGGAVGGLTGGSKGLLAGAALGGLGGFAQGGGFSGLGKMAGGAISNGALSGVASGATPAGGEMLSGMDMAGDAAAGTGNNIGTAGSAFGGAGGGWLKSAIDKLIPNGTGGTGGTAGSGFDSRWLSSALGLVGAGMEQVNVEKMAQDQRNWTDNKESAARRRQAPVGALKSLRTTVIPPGGP